MARGKQTCRILKEIRQRIAKANDIEFITSECTFKGNCLGTCPKCEAEVRYLEQQLRARSIAGKAVALAGISATALAMLVPSGAEARLSNESQQLQDTEELITGIRGPMTAPADTFVVSGRVLEEYTLPDSSISLEPLIGAAIINNNSRIYTFADTTGCFSIKASEGDSLNICLVGMEEQQLIASKDMDNPTVILKPLPIDSLGGGGILGIISSPISDTDHRLILKILDEHGKIVDPEIINAMRIRIDEDGDEDWDYISMYWDDDEQNFIIYWNDEHNLKNDDGTPLDKATLCIEADGYDKPVIIKVKAPDPIRKKTIRFKRNKNE